MKKNREVRPLNLNLLNSHSLLNTVLFYSNINGSFWNIFVGADHLGQKCHPLLFLFLRVLRKVLIQWTYLHEYWLQTSMYAAKPSIFVNQYRPFVYSVSQTLFILHKQFLFHGFYLFVSASWSAALLGCTSVLPLVPAPGISWSWLTQERRVSSALKSGQVVERHRRDSPTAYS